MHQMTKIEPALTAEEWAEELSPEALETRAKRLEWAGRDAGYEDYISGMGVAALALYGRINWDMVDALRDATVVVAHHEDWLDVDEEAVAQLRELADLLESLLLPREGPK